MCSVYKKARITGLQYSTERGTAERSPNLNIKVRARTYVRAPRQCKQLHAAQRQTRPLIYCNLSTAGSPAARQRRNYRPEKRVGVRVNEDARVVEESPAVPIRPSSVLARYRGRLGRARKYRAQASIRGPLSVSSPPPRAPHPIDAAATVEPR
jgi:hypothetical protein